MVCDSISPDQFTPPDAGVGFTAQTPPAVVSRQIRFSKSERQHGQVRNHLKVTQVSGAKGVAALKSRRTDEQIREEDHLPILARIGIDFAATCAISLLKLSTGIAAKTSSR